MAKDPAFLFYPNDWIGGTMGMSFSEKGAYMELLMMQFNRGHMTEDMIGHAVGVLWDKVKHKFKSDEHGLWFNERLDFEKDRRKSYVNSRLNNKSGKNQHKTDKKNNKSEENVSGHMTSHMENVNVNVNVITEEIWGVGKREDLSDEQKKELMIILDMLNLWTQKVQEYPVEQVPDCTALLKIAYRIGCKYRIREVDVIKPENREIVMTEWSKIIDAVRADNFYFDFTLTQVEKNFQSINHKLINGKAYKPNNTAKGLATAGTGSDYSGL